MLLFIYSILEVHFMAHYSDRDNNGVGCLMLIILIIFVLGGVFITGEKSTKSRLRKEIIVENRNELNDYIESIEKLKLDYTIENSGEKKKIIISLSAD